MLHLFVEGLDDERFFNHIYSKVETRVIQYSTLKDSKVTSFISALEKIPDSPYLFFADRDQLSIPTKIKKIQQRYHILNPRNIFIVEVEIESWYLAGLSSEAKIKLRIRNNFSDTNALDKEYFDNIIPKNKTRIQIMSSILKLFSCDLAITNNRSYHYFCDHVGRGNLVDEI